MTKADRPYRAEDARQRNAGRWPADPPSAKRADRPENVDAESNLPQVEPPSASFLIQLFLIPLLIVAIIVSVWLMFSWIAHMSTRAEDLVQGIESLDKKSWQEALTLAQLIRDPGQDELRQNGAMARRLADLLERQLAQDDAGASEEEGQADFRIYLARAIGSFDVTDGVGALRQAAVHERSPSHIDVRRGALQAISLMAGRLGGDRLREADTELVAAVIETSRSRDDDPTMQLRRGQLRSFAAYALGLLGGADATERLVEMLDDPFPDARYNAATGLARLGDPRALGVVLEMLDPANKTHAEYERLEPSAADERFMSEEQRERNYQGRVQWKRSLVLRNGIQAAMLLIESQPDLAQHAWLTEAIERLEQTELPVDVVTELRRLRQAL